MPLRITPGPKDDQTSCGCTSPSWQKIVMWSKATTLDRKRRKDADEVALFGDRVEQGYVLGEAFQLPGRQPVRSFGSEQGIVVHGRVLSVTPGS